MIDQWYRPFCFSEWAKRVFSVINLMLFFISVTFVFSEFRFDWVEKTVGTYLISTNELRPETGVIWETGKHAANAHEFLNNMVSKKEDARKTVHTADSFSALVSSLNSGEWVTLEKHHFKTLYLALDRGAAAKIIEPAQLVWLLNGPLLDRIFCEGVSDGIKLYFIDSDNRVIKQIHLKNLDILEIETGEVPLLGGLDRIEEFSGRIYSADHFFNALFNLPQDILPDLMVDPEILLKQEGKIIRVGIWNEAENGYIKLGFEFEENNQSSVVFVKGREWAVWQLSLNLKGENL